MSNQTFLEKFNTLPDALKTEVEHYIEFLLEKYAHSEKEREANKGVKEHLTKKRDGFGILKGKIWMSEDFDEPLEEMKEYME